MGGGGGGHGVAVAVATWVAAANTGGGTPRAFRQRECAGGQVFALCRYSS